MLSPTYEQRIKSAQALMSETDAAWMLVPAGADMIYFLGIAAKPSERLALLLIPQSGKSTMIVPELERSIFEGHQSILSIQTWNETDDPIQLVKACFDGNTRPTLLVCDQMWSRFLVEILDAVPNAKVQRANPVTGALRMLKDQQEIEYLQSAANSADKAWNEFIRTVTLAGKTEREAASELAELRKKHGLVVDSIGICASGPNSANPHHLTGDRVIGNGDVVIFDFGGGFNHYRADVTRTVCIGQPTEKVQFVYDLVLKANDAALESFREGNICQDVDRAARQVIQDGGYGEYFIHRTGHGIGIDVHEEPYLVEGNAQALQAGMCCSDEPGIYVPGEFGVRIEDIMVLGKNGGERINHAQRELTVLS